MNPPVMLGEENFKLQVSRPSAMAEFCSTRVPRPTGTEVMFGEIADQRDQRRRSKRDRVVGHHVNLVASSIMANLIYSLWHRPAVTLAGAPPFPALDPTQPHRPPASPTFTGNGDFFPVGLTGLAKWAFWRGIGGCGWGGSPGHRQDRGAALMDHLIERRSNLVTDLAAEGRLGISMFTGS